MRILYWHRTLADGAEGVHIQAMVKAFRTLGHQVLIMEPPGVGEERRGRGLIEGLRRSLPGLAFEVAAIGYNVPEYVHLRRTIKAFAPDLMYARHAKFDVSALVAARGQKIPTVLEVNAIFTAAAYQRFEPIGLGRAARALERHNLRAASLVTAVSSPLAQQIHSVAGVTPLVVPNGTDPTEFDPTKADPRTIKERHGLRDGLIVGWTGILREWHGLERLIAALRKVPSARLIIVGDGPARKALEQYSMSIGVGSRVAITGRVPHDEVPSYLAAMDVGVVADEKTGVASPMKLLEYMSMGLAVVAPDVPNIRDIVTNGTDGLLFEDDDGSALAHHLHRLSVDTSLRRALGSMARQKVLLHRNWVAIARQVLEAATTVRSDRGSDRRNLLS